MTEKQCIRCAERNVGNMKTHTINHINNFEYLLINTYLSTYNRFVENTNNKR